MRILIVEDEPLIRQRLLRICGEYAGSRARFDAVATLEDAAERLTDRPYEGVMLDLNLEGEDGFSLLRQAIAGAFHTIVISAHRERALEAFELGVLDFVPKPFSRERIAKALDRLLDARQSRGVMTRYLGVWRAHGVGLVELSDVQWLRADGEHSEVRLQCGRIELHDKPLLRLETLLPPSFVRCHRSWIVNLEHVHHMTSAIGSRYSLTLHDKSIVPVGRSHVKALRTLIGLNA